MSPSPAPNDDPDPFDLRRFLQAQEAIYRTVLAELRGCRKQTHWMWFIFPQIAGLGHSPTSQHYAIQTRAEAQHYLAHPSISFHPTDAAPLNGARLGAWPSVKSTNDFGGVNENVYPSHKYKSTASSRHLSRR